ncbi:hypothetical protein CK223_15675 [Mesorhizobium loti]|nr:hypothetical protein CK223_15675 [Mesorhizobium loti]
MWITVFDVPTCSTIYLDKPMKNHTLMQTIAREPSCVRQTAGQRGIDPLRDQTQSLRVCKVEEAIFKFTNPNIAGKSKLTRRLAPGRPDFAIAIRRKHRGANRRRQTINDKRLNCDDLLAPIGPFGASRQRTRPRWRTQRTSATVICI